MAFTLDSSDFMQNFNTENLKTPTKSQIASKKSETTLSQLFMSSPDLLEPQNTRKPAQRTILKSKKRKITTSPIPEDYLVSQDSQDGDKVLQQA